MSTGRLHIDLEVPDLLAELLRTWTNNANIAQGPSIATALESHFSLCIAEIGPCGLDIALHVLVNILESPQINSLQPHLRRGYWKCYCFSGFNL